MTFAIVAHCPQTKMFGTAVASSSPAVAARCSFVRAGVGAVSSQNITDPDLGVQVLDLLARGNTAAEAVAALVRDNKHIQYRQLLAVDKNGNTSVFSGDYVLGIHAEKQKKYIAAAGNLLADRAVIDAMVDGFENCKTHFGDRLMAALTVGLAAGGETGAVHSAGLKIARDTAWAYADLRCDWSDDCPIAQLARIWQIYKPQMDDYVLRARQPQRAPAFNVPGDKT